MGFEFFDYNPVRGISFHEHEDDARGEAEATLDMLNDEMADSAFSWGDHNVDEICWGIVCGRTERTSVRKATDEEQQKGFDEIASYAVRDYDEEPLEEIKILRGTNEVITRDLDMLRGQITTVANGDRLYPDADNNLHIIANHINHLKEKIASLEARLDSERKQRLIAEQRLADYGRGCRCEGCARSYQAECPRENDRNALAALRAERKELE